jgi:hypothetical protein
MRWNRWGWLNAFGLLLVAAAGGAQTSTDRDEATVRAMVYSIYAGYALGGDRGARAGYSQSTADLLQKYESVAGNQPKAPLSGFDYYCECQAYTAKNALLLSVNTARVDPSYIDATAEYVLSQGARPKKIRIRFVKSNSWVIHDVYWSDGTDLRGVLRSILAGTWAGWPTAAQRVATPGQAKQPGCGSTPHCLEEPSFVAVVTDLRESMTNSLDPARVISVAMSFRNTTSEPLILAYGSPRPLVTDDRGNRYAISHYGRGGLGILDDDDGLVDPSFVLNPGESREATVEFSWRPRSAMVGRRLVVDLAVAEGQPNGEQWIPGRVSPLKFTGFDEPPLPIVAAPTTEAVVPKPVDNGGSAASVANASANPNACANRPACFSAEFFTAEITHVANPPAGLREVQFTVRFLNTAPKPLVLAYRPSSTIVQDDQGNRYMSNWPGMTEATGMGVAQGARSDPVFVLKPGEAREATFTAGVRPGNKPLGDTYRVGLVVQTLEFTPDEQLAPLRWVRVEFRDVTMSRWQKVRGALDAGTKR